MLDTVQLFQIPEKTSQERSLFLEIISPFPKFSHLKPYKTVKPSLVILNMTFQRIFKDLKEF